MSSTDSQLHDVDKSIQEAKKVVELGDALTRLKSNRDFKKVVMEGYFEKEAIRLVHLKADLNMQSSESQKSINTQIDSIGMFAGFLNTVDFRANLARKSITFDEEIREELIRGDEQ